MSEKLKTIEIQGNNYVTVGERLFYFRKHYKNWKIIDKILFFNKSKVVMMNGKDFKKEAEICIQSSIINPEGVTIATGFALEKENSSFINKTSYVENCQTSAWGRALANFGIGIEETVASADEVTNAINNQ